MSKSLKAQSIQLLALAHLSLHLLVERQPGYTDKAITIHSFEEYARVFGGLSRDSSMSYAVYQYFLNGGQDAVIVAIDDEAEGLIFTRERDADYKKTTKKVLEFVSPNPGDVDTSVSIYIEENTKVYDDNHINLYVKGFYNPTVEKDGPVLFSKAPTLESYFNLSLLDTDPRSIRRVLQDTSNYVHIAKPEAVISTSRFGFEGLPWIIPNTN